MTYLLILLFIALLIYISIVSYSVSSISNTISNFSKSSFPSKKYIDRLTNEWEQHNKIILSIDFDSTISPWKSIDNQDDIERCIKLILNVQGYTYNTIHTACNPDRYDEIKDYCKKKGIRVDSININPIQLPYGKNEENANSKIFYNHQLCDRSGLLESMDILENAYYLFRGKKELKRFNITPELG